MDNRSKPVKKNINKKKVVIIITLALIVLALFYLLFDIMKRKNDKLQTQLDSAVTQLSAAQAVEESLEKELDDYRKGPTYTQTQLDYYTSEAAKKEGNEVRKSMLEQMKERMLSGEGVVPMLRSFFSDEIVFLQGGKYYFIPIDETVTPRRWTNDNLVFTEGSQWYDYKVGDTMARHGIDVSSFQGDIDWKKVKDAGIDFAIIRMALRGYGTGKIVDDAKFEQNIKGALANGIDVGVYFFSEAINTEEAIEEAEYCIEKLRPYDIICPIAIDIEDVSDSDARTANLTQEEWTNNAVAFLERIKEEGYAPMVYGNMHSMVVMLDQTKLIDYEKWWAAYYNYFYYPYDFTVWQFSDKGRISGISEAVDLNIAMDGWFGPRGTDN